MTIEGGAKVNVPLFVNEGETIRINTTDRRIRGEGIAAQQASRGYSAKADPCFGNCIKILKARSVGRAERSYLAQMRRFQAMRSPGIAMKSTPAAMAHQNAVGNSVVIFTPGNILEYQRDEVKKL